MRIHPRLVMVLLLVYVVLCSLAPPDAVAQLGGILDRVIPVQRGGVPAGSDKSPFVDNGESPPPPGI